MLVVLLAQAGLRRTRIRGLDAIAEAHPGCAALSITETLGISLAEATAEV